MVARTGRLTGFGLAVTILAACGAQPVDNQALLAAFRDGRAAEVTVQGRVVTAPEQVAGDQSAHERFRLDVGSGLVVEVDHNIGLAPAVPAHAGDSVTLHGQFEPDPGHPVIHYTHHATAAHEGGWIDLNGRRYE